MIKNFCEIRNENCFDTMKNMKNLDYCMEYGDYVEFIYNVEEKKLVLKKEND